LGRVHGEGRRKKMVKQRGEEEPSGRVHGSPRKRRGGVCAK